MTHGIHRLSKYGLVLLLFLGTGRCSEPLDVLGTRAYVYGNVITPAGAPVAGARVRGLVFDTQCVIDTLQAIGGGEPVLTNTSGYYWHVLTAINGEPFPGCVRVDVYLGSSATPTATTTGATVPFTGFLELQCTTAYASIS